MLQTGGFHLTKFAVNDENIMSEIPDSQRAKEIHDFSDESLCRALGVKWCIKDDAVFFEARAAPNVGRCRCHMSCYVTVCGIYV